MPNGSTHQAVGAVAGIVGYLFDDNPEPGALVRLAFAVATSIMAAKIPDKLEPATSPHHRQFFHSVFVLCGVMVAIKMVLKWKTKEPWKKLLRLMLLAVGVSYLSHLLLDAGTPMRIPLVGKL